ncbi:MAG: hypothetical protein IJ192_07990 [Clostridia bacterium]|nr:hypothetical protein [Clostridia bacterium]
MRKNIYTETIDSIRVSDKAVGKALAAVRKTDKGDIIMVKHNKLKFTGMVAASLAVVIAGGTVAGQLLSSNQAKLTSSTISSQAPKNVSSPNSFTLMVNAAELTKEATVVSASGNSDVNNSAKINVPGINGFNMSEGDDFNGYTVGYALPMDISCIGENIKSVTYSVDVGAISVSYYKDENPVIGGTETNRCDNTPEYGVPLKPKYQKLEDELAKEIPDNTEGEVKLSDEDLKKLEQIDKSLENTEMKHYSSITIDNNDSSLDYTSISLVGSSEELSKEERDYLEAHRDELFSYNDESKIEEQKVCVDKLINGQVIHCTVTFNDGTQQTQDIKVGTTIATFGEVFLISEEIPDEKYDTYKDDKDVYLTYALA